VKRIIIGVDIGGTKIAAGVVSPGGKLIDSLVLPTLAGKGKNASLDRVILSVETLLSNNNIDRKRIKGIGLCAPGPLDPVKGVVHNPPNLPGWKEVPLVSVVRRKFKVPSKLENDANAAGKAEMIWGAAKGYKNVFYVTVSTGIGTGIIIDGQIYHGKNGMAGEGGHVTIDHRAEGDMCGCGRAGCIEALASGPHTVRRLKKKLKSKGSGQKTSIIKIAQKTSNIITMKTIAEAAKKKDKLAIEIIREQGYLLGIWLGGMISILDPEIIVIGGGVSMIGELLFKEIRKTAHKHTINIYAQKTPIVRAKLRKQVGVFGAASLFMGK